ncbi:MAG TPA: glycosyltransferase [Anaeromyxobacter sp.]|nr:glycosyltransferase [Anaeromyxobacter sp.]
MRVLQVIPTLSAEGAQRMMANLCRELRRSGHEVGVISLFDPSAQSLQADLVTQGVEVHSLGKRMGPDLRMFRRVAAEVIRFAPEVIHSHLYVLKYLLPGALIRRRRCPVVHTIHSLAEHEGGTLADLLVQRAAFRLGVTAVSIGEAVSRSFRRLYGAPPGRTIPNGIPVDDYAPPRGAREVVRALLGIGEAPVFVTVGRLVPEKNQAAALEAVASRRLRSLSAHLLVAGDGPLREALAGRARELGVADRVHLLGSRRDVARVLAAADVFVLPSTYEGHPLSVLEAMAAGKPVVATAVGCVPETVSGATGRLVVPGAAGALESAMYELAASPALARALGAEGRRVAGRRFDSGAMARAYEQLYRELLSAGAARASPAVQGAP